MKFIFVDIIHKRIPESFTNLKLTVPDRKSILDIYRAQQLSTELPTTVYPIVSKYYFLGCFKERQQ